MNKVTAADVDNFITILNWANQQTPAVLTNYIIDPLQRHVNQPEKYDIKNLTANLEAQRKIQNWKIVGNIYRKLLQHYAFLPDHKPLIDILSRLLLDLQSAKKLLESAFAVEIFNIFEVPLKGLQTLYTSSVEEGFDIALQKQVQTSSESNISINSELSEKTKATLNEDAELMFRRIEQLYAMGDMNRLSYMLAQFTGKFCNFPGVVHREHVDLIIQKVCEHDADFQREVKDRLSIRIFKGIANSVEKGDINRAVRGIATYVLTFQDDLDIAYRSELDRLEEKLYAYIAKHNLWHRVRVKKK